MGDPIAVSGPDFDSAPLYVYLAPLSWAGEPTYHENSVINTEKQDKNGYPCHEFSKARPLEVMDLQYLLLQDTALSQGLVLVAHKIRTT